jgi:hypothetical protein
MFVPKSRRRRHSPAAIANICYRNSKKTNIKKVQWQHVMPMLEPMCGCDAVAADLVCRAIGNIFGKMVARKPADIPFAATPINQLAVVPIPGRANPNPLRMIQRSRRLGQVRQNRPKFENIVEPFGSNCIQEPQPTSLLRMGHSPVA